jgi:hypothetical protein
MREQCYNFFYCRGIASQEASFPSQPKTKKEQEPLSPLAAFTPLETGVFLSLTLEEYQPVNCSVSVFLCLYLFSGDGQQQRFLILFRNGFSLKGLGGLGFRVLTNKLMIKASSCCSESE